MSHFFRIYFRKVLLRISPNPNFVCREIINGLVVSFDLTNMFQVNIKKDLPRDCGEARDTVRLEKVQLG
jgi:hypothetical protein